MGRVLALDSGTVRIGVAVSDPLGITAQPHSSLDAASPDLMADISQLVESLDVERIVVGLPVSLDGTEGASARLARDLADRITEATGVEVSLIDERFSTVTAERVMIEAGARRSERRAARDRVAAAVFLQAYLDGMR
ncbi:MAG: Holliday junction resolvase RuvX [Acidimicrobiia bacterium]|jgi:putative Holliday junction resolvase